MPFDVSIISSVALGIALSACCGFRVFIPLLAASAAGYFHWYDLSPASSWMATLPALICFATAAVMEVLAYYIPVVDNLLDTIATPLSVLAGTVLASSILPIDPDQGLLRWGMALLAGGATAGTLQLGTGILRLFTTKTTAGTGNAVVATSENAAAIGGVAMSFLIPVVMAVLIVLLVIYLLYRLLRGGDSNRNG